LSRSETLRIEAIDALSVHSVRQAIYPLLPHAYDASFAADNAAPPSRQPDKPILLMHVPPSKTVNNDRALAALEKDKNRRVKPSYLYQIGCLYFKKIFADKLDGNELDKKCLDASSLLSDNQRCVSV